MERGMIKTLMFDLGGTLHTVKRTPASRLRFCAHLIDILGRHGIPVTLSPQELDAMLAVNGEEYKHFGERHLVELPQSVIWSKYFLKELHIDEARLAPFAEEMSFLYDQERMENIPRPQLRETMEALHGMGIRLGVISNIISTTLVPYALKEYGIDRYMECVVMSRASASPILGSSRSPWTRCTPSRRRRATWGTLSPGTCWAPGTRGWACACASTTLPSPTGTRPSRGRTPRRRTT